DRRAFIKDGVIDIGTFPNEYKDNLLYVQGFASSSCTWVAHQRIIWLNPDGPPDSDLNFFGTISHEIIRTVTVLGSTATLTICLQDNSGRTIGCGGPIAIRPKL